MVVRHELQHGETMRQTLALAGLLSDTDVAARERPMDGADAGGWVEIAASAFELGAPPDGFAYDNERPRHLAGTAAFAISRLPVSNREWKRFATDGGYERRELWSPHGWTWLQEQGGSAHPALAGRDPDAPAINVSWFEADAFARAHGARLPSETEWEKAATVKGSELAGVGRVWEWTASQFDGYPGFVAHPYREYSEVFFARGYRVLRGASWATDPRVASVHFRNWDLPQRRQIFAGVRLARD
jgi:iron(II)-dependent oxidoreductase